MSSRYSRRDKIGIILPKYNQGEAKERIESLKAVDIPWNVIVKKKKKIPEDSA